MHGVVYVPSFAAIAVSTCHEQVQAFRQRWNALTNVTPDGIDFADESMRLQLAQFLCADTRSMAAAFWRAMPAADASGGANMFGPPASRTRSHGPADTHAQPPSAACQVVAQQHPDVADIVVAAHPVLADRRKPLLSHKVAALPADTRIAGASASYTVAAAALRWACRSRRSCCWFSRF
jgi:hypothetical protein